MARINIEDDLESEEPFWNLLPLVNGDREKALGRINRFFRLAQERYGHREILTKEDLEKTGMTSMIEAGWAIPQGDGYGCFRGEERFAWYRQKIDASRKGGRPPKPESDLGFRDETETRPPVPAANREVPPANPLTLSPSLSLSLSSSEEEGEAEKPPPSSPPTEPDFWSQIAPETIRSWEDAYGSALVLKQLPLVKAGWLSESDFKKRTSHPAKYARNWLQGEFNKAEDEKTKAAVRGSGPSPPSDSGGYLPTDNRALELMLRDSAEAVANRPSREFVRSQVAKVLKGPEPPKPSGRDLAAGKDF